MSCPPSRFTPRSTATAHNWIGRYYRPNPDVPVIGYKDKAEAQAALADALAVLTPGCPVTIDGRQTIFVGYSHAKMDPDYRCHRPMILVRSPNGDVFVSIYDVTEPQSEANLHDYQTGAALRPATEEELQSSIEAARRDGGAGVIEIDGRSCFVA